MRLGTTAGFVLAAVLGALPAQASDHRDGSNVIAAPDADIGDVFAWMSRDATTLHLAMTVSPNAGGTFPGSSGAQPTRFSTTAKYVFNINSRPRALDPWVSGAAAARDRARYQIIATFDGSVPQRLQLWLVDLATGQNVEYVSGQASTPQGLTSEDGRLRVYTGLRRDPAFFNREGFDNMVAQYQQYRDGGQLANATGGGCRPLDTTQIAAIRSALSSGANGGAATNSFANQNVLAIVVSLDKTLINQSGSLTAVWGSTHR